MKKLFTLLAGFFMLATSVTVSAQSPGDTLGWSEGTVPKFAPNGTSVLYPIGSLPGFYRGYGYFHGTQWIFPHTELGNPDSPLGPEINPIVGLAQGFVVTNPCVVVGIAALIKEKRKGPLGASTSISFRVAPLTDDGGSTLNAQTGQLTPNDIPGPGATLAMAEVLYDEIDPESFTYAPFAEPVEFNEDFFVTVDYQAYRANGDTLAFLSDQTGAGQGLNYSFHQMFISNQKFWVRSGAISSNIGDNNIAMFPVIGQPVSLESAPFYGNLRAVAVPNPANEIATVRFQNQHSGNYSLELISIKGQQISAQDLGFRPAGEHQAELNISGLPAGMYLYSIVNKDDGSRYISRVVVSH